MATVGELSAPYTNFMLSPPPPTAADVCGICHRVHFGQLHTALQQYKRAVDAAARHLQLQLAAVLWRFLAAHEQCVARAAGAGQFELVTTVPSSDLARDEMHPPRRIVGEIVEPTQTGTGGS